MQVSNDTGQSIGSILKLALNGKIGQSSQERQLEANEIHLSYFASEIVMRFLWINSLKMIYYVFGQLILPSKISRNIGGCLLFP